MPPKRNSKPLSPELGALGGAIELIAKEQEVSLNAVAKAGGLSSEQIGRYARGHGNPTYTTLLKIAAGLDVPLGRLMACVDVLLVQARNEK